MNGRNFSEDPCSQFVRWSHRILVEWLLLQLWSQIIDMSGPETERTSRMRWTVADTRATLPASTDGAKMHRTLTADGVNDTIWKRWWVPLGENKRISAQRFSGA